MSMVTKLDKKVTYREVPIHVVLEDHVINILKRYISTTTMSEVTKLSRVKTLDDGFRK